MFLFVYSNLLMQVHISKHFMESLMYFIVEIYGVQHFDDHEL